MLELSSFDEAKNTLNIKSVPGFFASFSITDRLEFSNIPCGSRLFGLCSVGVTFFGYELKLGPALTRQNIRYEKRIIDNEASKLRERVQDEETTKIEAIAKSCKERADMDLDARDVPFIIFGMGPIQRIQKTDAAKIFTEFSNLVLSIENAEEIHACIDENKNICIRTQDTEESQPARGLQGVSSELEEEA